MVVMVKVGLIHRREHKDVPSVMVKDILIMTLMVLVGYCDLIEV